MTLEVAREGDVVFVGGGCQHVLADEPQVLKVLLVSELEDRIRFMMDHYTLSRSKAESLVKREERRRANFLKLFSPKDPDDPELYNMVINTSRVSLEEAEALVVKCVGRILDEYATPIW